MVLVIVSDYAPFSLHFNNHSQRWLLIVDLLDADMVDWFACSLISKMRTLESAEPKANWEEVFARAPQSTLFGRLPMSAMILPDS